MAKYISPIFEDFKPFSFTSNRFFTAFKPIQGTGYKKTSDLLAYALTPFIDVGIAPVFLLDAVINLCNLVATLAKTAFKWTFRQQQSSNVIDSGTSHGLEKAKEQFLAALSSIVAAIINPILSILSLATRPIASVVKGVADAIEQCSEASSQSERYGM